ncbi:MAG: Trk system potassium transporter TrkA [Lachnospiraceae bacterium]|nr:Trk system potassium transporter TrkA [Lachnospiraceae bacterium]
MQIIVVGCGKVGKEIVKQLAAEGHNVTVVDKNSELVKSVSNEFDVMGVIGNGTSYMTLSSADLEHTDVLIAVTPNDEVNLLCCVVAKKSANCHTIARIRNHVYSTERSFIQRELGLSMIINPEMTAAREISRRLSFPSAIEIDTFAKGRVELLKFEVAENSPLVGVELKQLSQKISGNFLVCVAERGEEIIIPDGNFMPQAGDILGIITDPADAMAFFKRIKVKTNSVKNTMIVGGGQLTYYLADLLLKSGGKVKIIERDMERCEELSELLDRATIICGDGTDVNLLDEEHLDQMDGLVTCTGMDEQNLVLSLYAQDKVRTKIVTKMSHVQYDEVVNRMHIGSVINPKKLAAVHILRYVRAMGNTIGSKIETMYRLIDGKVEALEFIVSADSKVKGIKLMDMKFKKNVLIAAIARQGKLIVPGGQDEFKTGDSVVVVTKNLGCRDFSELLR